MERKNLEFAVGEGNKNDTVGPSTCTAPHCGPPPTVNRHRLDDPNRCGTNRTVGQIEIHMKLVEI